jgi:hypothetical protein
MICAAIIDYKIRANPYARSANIRRSGRILPVGPVFFRSRICGCYGSPVNVFPRGDRLRVRWVYVVETVFLDLIAHVEGHYGEVDRLVVAELRPGAREPLELVITENLAKVHESLIQPRLS